MDSVFDTPIDRPVFPVFSFLHGDIIFMTTEHVWFPNSLRLTTNAAKKLLKNTTFFTWAAVVSDIYSEKKSLTDVCVIRV